MRGASDTGVSSGRGGGGGGGSIGGGGGGGSIGGGGGVGVPEMRERRPSGAALPPRMPREEGFERTKHLSGEEAIDAEIEQTTDAFNELVG